MADQPKSLVGSGRPTETMPGAKILVASPSHDMCPANFAFDLARLFATLCINVGGGDVGGVNLYMLTGTYVPRARQEIAMAALQHDYTHILWLDADMRFPMDAAIRLLEHDKEVVGINYSTRSVTSQFTAIKSIGNRRKGDPAFKCVTLPPSKGLEEVEAIGFGVLLMKTSIFERLHDPAGARGHWFQTKCDEETGTHMGEDVYFCRLARRAGAKIYVDHDLSKECGHIGQLVYTIEHAQDRFTFENMPVPQDDD